MVLSIRVEHIIPPITGLDSAQTITATEADLYLKPIGHKVIFCSRDLSASECAISLPRHGHECVLIDRLPQEQFLTNLMDSLTETFRTTLKEMNITLYDNASIREIHTGSVLVK